MSYRRRRLYRRINRTAERGVLLCDFVMPNTVEELIEWLKANQETKIHNLPDDQYACIDRWREAFARHIKGAVSFANSRQFLQWIELTREIFGPDAFDDIKDTFYEV